MISAVGKKEKQRMDAERHQEGGVCNFILVTQEDLTERVLGGSNYRGMWREQYFKQQEKYAEKPWGKIIFELFEKCNKASVAGTEWGKQTMIEFEVNEWSRWQIM